MGFGILSGIRSFTRRLGRGSPDIWVLRSWLDLKDLPASRMVLDSMRLPRVVEPVLRQPPAGKSILVLAPHPDDEMIGPGGTLLGSVESGSSVTVLFVTNGRAGESDIRRGEAERLCREAGFACRMAGFRADDIPLHEAAEYLVGLLRQDRYDCVFLPFLLDDHDDHRRISEVLLAAAARLDSEPAFEIWAYQVYGVLPLNGIVDITGHADRKAALIACHQSQMQKRDWSHFALGMNAVLSRFLPPGNGRSFAEAFLVLSWQQYLALAQQILSLGPYSTAARYRRERHTVPVA